jgi:hypothetical protein
MDSVRNMTGSPISGIDPHELLDVRGLSSGAARGQTKCDAVMPFATRHLEDLHQRWQAPSADRV